MNRSISLFLILSMSPLSANPASDRDAIGHSQPWRQSLREAGVIGIYEGLPHPTFEAKLLAAELERADSIQLAGHPFYRSKVEAVGAVAGTLRECLADADSLRTFYGEKRCGGFHPDYAVSWSHDSKQTLALICYGCQEVIFYREGVQFRYDLRPRALTTLQKALVAFASQRPRSQ